MPRLPILIASLALSVGCASVSPTVRASGFGRVDTVRDRAVAAQAGTQERAASRVEAVYGQLPPGLSLQGEQVVVQRGYERTYRVLGRVEADLTRQVASAPTRNWLTSWNYDQGWRKGLCWPQVPLKILTLGLWTASPTHYPCVAVLPAGEHRRQEVLLDHLKRGTAAMGGDLVVVVGVGAMQQTRVDSWGFAYPGRFRNMTQLRGIAIAVDGMGPAAPAGPPSASRPSPLGSGAGALPGGAPPPPQGSTPRQSPPPPTRRPPPRR